MVYNSFVILLHFYLYTLFNYMFGFYFLPSQTSNAVTTVTMHVRPVLKVSLTALRVTVQHVVKLRSVTRAPYVLALRENANQLARRQQRVPLVHLDQNTRNVSGRNFVL